MRQIGFLKPHSEKKPENDKQRCLETLEQQTMKFGNLNETNMGVWKSLSDKQANIRVWKVLAETMTRWWEDLKSGARCGGAN